MDYFATLLAELHKALYKFDEYRGITLFDFSNNAYNLTIHGTPTFKAVSLVSDWPNGSIHFNVNGDYVDGDATPFITNNAITIAGMLKPDTIAQIGNIIRCGENDNMLSWAVEQNNAQLLFKW